MAFADNDAPFAPADHDRHAVTEPMIGRRHRRDAAAIARMAPGEKIAVGLVEPRPPREAACRRGIIRRPLAGHHAGVQPLLLGDPQGRVPALGEPAGEPDMVRMIMCDDDPADWAAGEALGEDPLPRFLGFRQGEAAIDDRPARPVVEQPQIDVVEREGQLHAQPQHAGRDRDQLARRGRRLDRKIKQFGHVSEISN